MPEIVNNEQNELDDDLADDDAVVPYTYAITSYGADYPVDGLVKRIRDGAILIPEFQRKFVWKKPQASRFVESLLLGLPVPGVFFEKEQHEQKLLIIDGQQRLLSLSYFYEGLFADTKREFTLTGVQEQFEGKTYKTLSEEDRRRLDDSIIHATVVRQDEPSDDRGSIYHVFERLNTGGMPLSPQEIRTCVYHGPFCELLKQLNQHETWREIFGSESSRMKDHELILRFFALAYESDDYSRPMKGFLNKFMGIHRNLELRLTKESLTEDFTRTIDCVFKAIGKRAFRPKSTINAAVFDAVSVAVKKRLEKGEIEDFRAMETAYTSLLESDDFEQAYMKSTADESSVRRRIELATEAFADIQ